MKILALETSGLGGSVAIAEGARMLKEISLPPEQRSARALAPAMRQALHEVGWKPHDVEVIAVTSGPGSFTGLRVGVVTAKTFAYATGCRIVGVNTLQVLAWQVATPGEEVLTILDAQRGEYFAARWAMNSAGEILAIAETRILATDELLQGIAARTTIAGPVVHKLAGQLPSGANAIAACPQANAVAALALRMAHRGETTDAFALTPHYLRRTAAEEQWEQRQMKSE
jgi:tRNA threonylcarbamoyladenosine biosynthesis protein TsaB